MQEFPENAYGILFEMDWGGNGPLFQNQQELVLELLANPKSDYHITRATATDDELNKATSRLKTYISQLFTGTTKRNVTKQFRQSLLILLQEKLPANYNPQVILIQIINSLVARNITKLPQQPVLNEWSAYNDIIEHWIETTIINKPGPDVQYNLGKASGIREGALLLWSILKNKV